MDPTRVNPLALRARLERQHGVITHEQLLRLGLSHEAIRSRVRRGALVRLWPGVYAVGHAALRPEGHWLAAVLFCGPGAVLSHQSAAALWERRVREDGVVHVTTAGRHRSRPGLVVHRTQRIGVDDVTRRRGIAVTSVPRTLIDLADVVSFDELRAVADHGVRLDERALRAAAARHPGRRGAPSIARLLGDGVRTRSELERAFRRLCRRHGLPQPLVNAQVAGLEVDFHWPEHRLIVETDGHGTHAQRLARSRDHARDARLQAAGWRVLRVLWDDVVHAPAEVATRLCPFVGRLTPSGSQ